MFHLSLIAALAIASPGGHAPAPTAEAKFDLRANHGLSAHVSSLHILGEDVVSLEIVDRGKRHSVTYRTVGKVTESGITARFGKLGAFEADFKPTKSQKKEPPKGCRGEPSTTSEGYFSGRFEFAGERHYVRIDRTRAKGELNVENRSTWSCTRRKQGNPKGESVLLTVTGRGNILEAIAERDSRGRGLTIFAGGGVESREGMQITRLSTAHGGASALVFDHAGTGTVRPPAPFTGRGRLVRRAHGRYLWSSTIRVPVLGAAPVSFRGRGFRAELQREFFRLTKRR
jgi:hypothetical protein